MAHLTEAQRREKVDFLVNCECWKDDRETVNRFTDEKLVKLVDHEINAERAIKVANAAAGGLVTGNQAYRVNPETGEWEEKTIKTGKKATRNARGKAMANFDDEEEVMEDEVMEDEDMEDEEEEGYMKPSERDKMNKKRMALNRSKPKRPATLEEWIRSAPDDVQQYVANAQQIEQREKDKIIAQLLANVAESHRAAHHERLQQRSLNELVNDLALVPKPPSREEVERATGMRTTNRRHSQTADDDMLQMPTVDWSRVNNGENTETHATTNRREQVDLGDDGNDDEWMKSAPPNVRAAVQNALAIEQREKRKIIDELVENVNDEEKETKLRARLMNKSLEELQDMTALRPPQPPPSRPNYFGSSTPLANQLLRTTNVDEDVLPPPRMDWSKAN